MTTINKILFDEEVVKTIKQRKVNEAHLYNLLYNGKITLKEYLQSLS